MVFFCVCRRPDGGGAEGAQKKPFLSSAVPTPFFLSLPLPYRKRKEAAFLSAASPFLPLFGVEESILSLSEAGQGNDEPKRERERDGGKVSGPTPDRQKKRLGTS